MGLQTTFSDHCDFGIANYCCRVVWTNHICRRKINQSPCTVNTMPILHARQEASYWNRQDPWRLFTSSKLRLFLPKPSKSLKTNLASIPSVDHVQSDPHISTVDIWYSKRHYLFILTFSTTSSDSIAYIVRYLFWLFIKYLSAILEYHWIIIRILDCLSLVSVLGFLLKWQANNFKVHKKTHVKIWMLGLLGVEHDTLKFFEYFYF